MKDLAADWPPALLAALELETIAKHGGDAAAGDAAPDLQIVVDKLRELAGEPAQRNRFERRKHAKQNLSRRERLGEIRAGVAN